MGVVDRSSTGDVDERPNFLAVEPAKNDPNREAIALGRCQDEVAHTRQQLFRAPSH